MQEKTLKTWSINVLFAITIGIELINIALSIVSKNLLVAFLLCIIGIPLWLFVASYLCAAIPFLKTNKFTLYFAEEIPEDDNEDYHILLGNDDGFILFKDKDAEAVSAWTIDNSIYNKKVKEVWKNL